MSMLEPLVRFVGQLSFSNKLRATALVFGIPLLAGAGLLFYALNERVTELKLERAALAVQAPAFALLADLHRYGATRQALQDGAAQLAPRIDALRADLDRDLVALDAALAAQPLLADALAVRKQWLGRRDEIARQLDAVDADGLAELAGALRGEIDKLNEDTGLLIDGNAANSRLLDIVTTHVPSLIDTTGKAARIGASVLVKQSIRGSRRTELTVQRGNFDALVQWGMEGLQKVAREHPERAARLDEAGSRLNTAYLGIQEALTIKMLDTSDFDMAPEVFLDLTAKAQDETLAIGGIVAAEADALLAHRLAVVAFQRNAVVAVMALGLALLLAGFVAAYISIMRGLNGLSSAVDTMASGDLDARAEIHSSDEIGKLATQFNVMAETLAQSTEQLREKTNAIHGMLQNMPQGILTVVAGGHIHHEYSAYLATIFETGDIAGRPALDFLFAATDLGADARSQVEATLFACLGEDRMNFEFNAHLLVGAAVMTLPDGRVKYLDFGWSPICDENDTVEKIMVCVRDVTELRQLEAAAARQQRELEMIGQILKVNQEKFHEFADSARNFAAANETLLNAAEQPTLDLVTQLFRNMHTIKGNARTYGLLHLTNRVHEAEQAYDALRRSPEMRWDKPALLAQLREVMDGIEEYATLNDVKLGRKGPGRRGGAEKYAMVEKARVDGMLELLNAYDLRAVSRETLAALLAQVKLDLRLIGTERVKRLLDGILASMPALAGELGKAPPNLVVADADIHIRNQAGDLLRNVFMHLYRNALDHGIETPDERRANGKAEAGTIRLDLALADGKLKLRLADDGRGLALGHIRRKGVEKGLIGTDGADADVANLIFAAGFSTATVVTEVSGRGVGMDAVRDFVKREGGDIRLVLVDDAVGAAYRAFATEIDLPENLAVAAAPTIDAPLVHQATHGAHAEDSRAPFSPLPLAGAFAAS